MMDGDASYSSEIKFFIFGLGEMQAFLVLLSSSLLAFSLSFLRYILFVFVSI
jgi:hypothetical protein